MFQYSAITSYGLAALSGSITEDNILKVTRIEYGDGIIEELKTATTASAILEIIRHQTSLVNKKCDLSVYKIEKKENSDVRTIVGVVDQLSVVEDFNAREAAIYAEYNGQEILFAYFTAVAFIDGEKTDTSNYISKVALSVKPCYFVTNISMANSTEIDYIFDADLSLPTITPTKIEGGYLLKIKDSLGEKTVEIKNRHLAGAGLKEDGDYLTAPVATQTTNGIMTASDKAKLDGIATGANKYTLPNATATTLGGVIVGAGLSVSNGKVSAPVATQTTNGIMTASDKAKLDGIATGANKYIHPTTAGNKHIPTGGATGQILGHSESGTAEWTGRHDFIYTCTTVATTSAKTVKLPGFKLEKGSCVRVVFTNGNSVASPTLNVNSTGAKEIRTEKGKALSTVTGNLKTGAYSWQENTILELMYDDACWIVLGNPIVQNFVDKKQSFKLYIDGYKEIHGIVNEDLTSSLSFTVNLPLPISCFQTGDSGIGNFAIGGYMHYTETSDEIFNNTFNSYIKFGNGFLGEITVSSFQIIRDKGSYRIGQYVLTGYVFYYIFFSK